MDIDHDTLCELFVAFGHEPPPRTDKGSAAIALLPQSTPPLHPLHPQLPKPWLGLGAGRAWLQRTGRRAWLAVFGGGSSDDAAVIGADEPGTDEEGAAPIDIDELVDSLLAEMRAETGEAENDDAKPTETDRAFVDPLLAEMRAETGEADERVEAKPKNERPPDGIDSRGSEASLRRAGVDGETFDPSFQVDPWDAYACGGDEEEFTSHTQPGFSFAVPSGSAIGGCDGYEKTTQRRRKRHIVFHVGVICMSTYSESHASRAQGDRSFTPCESLKVKMYAGMQAKHKGFVISFTPRESLKAKMYAGMQAEHKGSVIHTL